MWHTSSGLFSLLALLDPHFVVLEVVCDHVNQVSVLCINEFSHLVANTYIKQILCEHKALRDKDAFQTSTAHFAPIPTIAVILLRLVTCSLLPTHFCRIAMAKEKQLLK